MIRKLRMPLFYGCTTYCILRYIGDFVVCSGESMEPTIHDSDFLLTEKISVRKQNIERGDIVIAKSPKDPSMMICKRVLALAGDSVQSKGMLHHSLVPKGSVWLEGDNKSNSIDSREYGPVSYGLIQSRAFYKILPLSDKGYLPQK